MKVIAKAFEYNAAPYGKIAYIPAGLAVVPATNLPQGGYWVADRTWADEKAESWQRNYGFHVTEEQVCEAPFQVGQRVRIKPCGHWPAIKSVRYGIIHGATQVPGMHLVNEDGRENLSGEWAFIVASYASPNAGAMWFSEKGLEPMRRERKTVLT